MFERYLKGIRPAPTSSEQTFIGLELVGAGRHCFALPRFQSPGRENLQIFVTLPLGRTPEARFDDGRLFARLCHSPN
jgi:hypothetical protein